eukprot:TRINITY_DN8676_c1_g1_i1.p1 TRINITY_DN8676_c1_g1~~TRINITY_DN8676_c1_g1_i1.p1  ORF type:complete len:361 (+),score=88.50 TRINITY_DN8676_c1_g1_i1:42-1124(+)
MKLVTGTDNGLVKTHQILPENKSSTIDMWGSQVRNHGVDVLEWYNQQQEEVVVAYETGQLVISDLQSGNALYEDQFDTRLAGAHLLDNGILTCTRTGQIALKGVLVDGTKLSFDTERTVTKMRYHEDTETILLAGGENELAQVFDINTQQQVWKARNVPNDFLDMQVPILDKDVIWLKESSGRAFLSVTAHKHIRIYDIRAKRQPKISVDFGENPLHVAREDPLAWHSIAVSDSSANLKLTDMRKNFKVTGGFKGISGAIRDVQFHPTLPYIVATGLDRFVHAYHSGTRRYFGRLYIKQRQNKLLVAKDVWEQPEEDSDSLESWDSDLSEEWDSLPVVKERKREREEDDEPPRKKPKKQE